ncbi:hypothetical protein ACLB1Q_34220 [Escherichia coli]
MTEISRFIIRYHPLTESENRGQLCVVPRRHCYRAGEKRTTWTFDRIAGAQERSPYCGMTKIRGVCRRKYTNDAHTGSYRSTCGILADMSSSVENESAWPVLLASTGSRGK